MKMIVTNNEKNCAKWYPFKYGVGLIKNVYGEEAEKKQNGKKDMVRCISVLIAEL